MIDFEERKTGLLFRHRQHRQTAIYYIIDKTLYLGNLHNLNPPLES